MARIKVDLIEEDGFRRTAVGWFDPAKSDHYEEATRRRACESAIEGQTWLAGFAEGDDLIVIQHSGEDIDLISIPGEGTVSALIRYEPVDGESWEPEVYDAALAEAGWQRVGGWLRNRTEMRLRRTVR